MEVHTKILSRDYSRILTLSSEIKRIKAKLEIWLEKQACVNKGLKFKCLNRKIKNSYVNLCSSAASFMLFFIVQLLL